ncbi:Arm DNA-binding domain-containing protein, partial [Actinomycetota bacterium]
MGSVRKNGKSWQYVFDGPRDSFGRRHQVTKSGFPTKREAQKALRRALTEIDEYGHTETALTLGVWLSEMWMPSHRAKIRRS